MKIRQIGVDHAFKQSFLNIGDNALAHCRHQDLLKITGGALDHGKGKDSARNQEKQVERCLAEEDLIEHGPHHVGGRRCRRGNDDHAQDGKQRSADIGANEFSEQSPVKPGAALRLRLIDGFSVDRVLRGCDLFGQCGCSRRI